MSQLSDTKNIVISSSPQKENTEREADPITRHGGVDDISRGTFSSRVLHDYGELKKYYPFCSIEFLHIAEDDYAIIEVIAVKKKIIDATLAREEDFLEEFSRKLVVFVPSDYRTAGCIVQGAKWLDANAVPLSDVHLLNYGQTLLDRYVKKGYNLCVGAPDSFIYLKNVILENVRTADHMLTAYENFMRGNTDRVRLFGLKHGEEGIIEYRKLKEGGKIKCLTSKSASTETYKPSR